MSQRADERIGQMEGAAALPRKNGELVFEAPWEGRAFGMAVALSDSGLYEWDTFRGRLVTEIAAADRAGSSTTYYERWLDALETLVLARGFLHPDELQRRAAEYLSGEREDDDHDHNHDYEPASQGQEHPHGH